MSLTVNDVLAYVKENDVKFVKLTFCDMFGRQKTLSLLSPGLKNAFENGVAFDASEICGLMNITESDLLLFPVPDTLSVLPWRPQTGRVISLFCKLRYADGRDFEYDPSLILEKQVERLSALGMSVTAGTDCEFTVSALDEHGSPENKPYDNAGRMDSAPLDRCENLRRDVVLALENMGLKPLYSYHERGAGQNRIVFREAGPLTAARNMLLGKSAVENVCARDGIFASFAPKPFEGGCGNGMHLNISLVKDGAPLTDKYPLFGMFTEGVLKRLDVITAFTVTDEKSYGRLNESSAPDLIGWTGKNIPEAAVRVYGSEGRIKLRFPDCECNPFLALALVISAGCGGVENRSKLRAEIGIASAKRLPSSLDEALKLAADSSFVASTLTGELLDRYVAVKSPTATETAKP